MSFGKNNKGAIVREKRGQALGALGNSAGILLGTALVLAEDFRMLKAHAECVLTSLTSGEGTGLSLYLVSGAITLAQAEEAIESSGPLSRVSPVAEAISERYVKFVGMVHGDGPSSTEGVIRDGTTGGSAIVVKPRWTFSKAKGWNWMIYNKGAAITTGATATIWSQLFGVWVD